MKKYLIILLCLLVLSGCSDVPGSGGGSGTSQANHGDGLNVDFDIDSSFIPTLRYTLTLTNRGEEVIEIDRSQFVVLTSQRTVSGDVPLEEEDLQRLKDDLFSQGTLQIPPNDQRISTGTLRIKEDYYSRTTTERLNLELRLEYPYSTDFFSNVLVDLENHRLGRERIDMSGPIEVRDVEGIFHSMSEFSVMYTLRDRNRLASSVSIDSFNVRFGANELSCEYFRDESGSRVPANDLVFTESQRTVYALCGVNQEYPENEETRTITSGDLSYTYPVSIKEEVRFPR